MTLIVRRIGCDAPRVVVIHAEGPDEHKNLRPSVGVVPYETEAARRMAVVVKLGFLLEDSDGVPFRVAEPAAAKLTVDRPSRFEVQGQALLDEPSDFAIGKPATEIVIAGHAHARAPVPVIHGAVRVLAGDGVPVHAAQFVAQAGAASSRIPLAPPYLGTLAGVANRVGAIGSDARFRGGDFEEPIDPSVFAAAAPELSVELGRITAASVLLLTGVLPYREGDTPVAGSAVSERRVVLPGLEPRVHVEATTIDRELVPMVLDTIFIDSDAGRGALSWRGTVGPVASFADVHRLFVSLERIALERSEAESFADTQRGTVAYAYSEVDVIDGKAPPQNDARLEAERYGTWGETAPEPRILIETYANVSAELGEWPDKREQTLQKHGFDEDRWAVEERAWLEQFTADAVDGGGALVTHFGELFMAAQDRLVTPEEGKLTLRDYAGLRVELDRAADMATVLAEARLSLAQWMRFERRTLARVEADPAARAELEALVEELESERGDEDDGVEGEGEDEGEAAEDGGRWP